MLDVHLDLDTEKSLHGCQMNYLISSENHEGIIAEPIIMEHLNFYILLHK